MAPTLPAMTRPPPPPPPEHSTSTEPSSAAERASTSPTALSTKSHQALPKRKKRKSKAPPPPPPELSPAKTSDATEPASKKKLVLEAPCHAAGGGQSIKGAAQANSAGPQSGKGALAHKAKTLDEMRELYPHLVDEAMALGDPAELERVLPRIADSVAQALDQKVKWARRHLTKAIAESARMKNMETSTVFLCQATRLQLEKSRVDKEDGVDICVQERLARVEHDIVELRKIMIDSHYQATIECNPLHDNSSLKGVRCRSEESHSELAVAENQIPHNLLQKKVKVPNGHPHENNKEVTSKHDGVIPPRLPPDYLKYEGSMIKPPFNTFHGRTRKIDMESQTAPNMDSKEVVLLSIVRPHTPVGKGILQSSSPSTIVGGMTIGTECCKVFLSEVLKRDAPLFFQNREMKKMFDALKCSIAWPDSLIRRQNHC